MPTRLLALALLALLVPPAAAQERGEPRKWEHESSDIPVNPRIHFGHLGNGLRWAWMSNPKPEERCYLRLHVDAGSLAEGESERGMAHFLEHMAFNGSEHFPPGTLIEWFQSHGMAFGADTNAHTGFGESVYKLDLPRADVDAIREGLVVLRDFAGGLLLREEDIQAEKGVIDGEERERDSAGWRAFVKSVELAYAGTRLPERLPIGKKATRDGFTAESVRRFYETWYRPELMTLVLVGDIGELDPAPLFAELFADLEVPEGAPPREPPMGEPTMAQRFFSIYEREIPTYNLSLSRARPWRDEAASKARLVREIPLDLARGMLGLRYRELAKEEDAPFLGASADELGGTTSLRVFDGESLDVVSKPERWEAALSAAEQELRRAISFGFRPAQLDEVRANLLRGLDEAVQREPTLSSESFLAQILSAAEFRVVPVDAATVKSILEPAARALTAEDCHAAFALAWSKGELMINGAGNLDLGAKAGETLKAAYEKSLEVELEKPGDIGGGEFAYASTPEDAGEALARERIDDLGIERIELANGVRLWIKPTDFKKRQILITACLGAGELTLEPSRYALAWVADQVFDRSGLEAHSEDDLRRLTAGKQAGVGFSVGEDLFALGGATTADDLLLQCELMCAYLQHPGWRPEGLRQFRREVPELYEALAHQHAGPLLLDFLPALHGGDPRFGYPSREQVEAVTLEDLKSWLTPHLAADPLDVVIVGEVDVDAALAAAARTFGKLPRRSPPEDVSERRRTPGVVPGLEARHEIETETPSSLVLLAFPTTDGMQPQLRRALHLLGVVVDDRLRVEVRERLGASYSPGAGAESSTAYPGVGHLMIQAMAAPDDVPRLVEACLGVAGTLAEKGVGAEELERLKGPILAQLRDRMRTNGFWLEAIAEIHQRPTALEEARTIVAHIESIDAERISELAATYLKPERASKLVVSPKTAAKD
jgi:zinc protease